MNIKKPLLRWSVAVLAVLTLTACGSTTSSPTPKTSSPAIGDSTTSPPATGNPAVQKAQTGQVTFAVQFPQTALKKALMDNRTVSIVVEWHSYYPYYTSSSTLLTPDTVTGLATATLEVPVGYTDFQAIAKDSNNYQIDRASTAGEITAGSNTVYLTFLGGDWQFVDADDIPLPQSFSDGTTTTTLAGFNLTGQAYFAGPTKASVDLGKPSSWNEYQLQWHDNTPAALGPQMWAGHTAQFNAPAATGSSLGSDSLNITDPARGDAYNGGNPIQGDRLVWIHNWMGDGWGTITDANNVDLTPQFRAAGDSQVLDGNHIGGHLMAATFESYTPIVTGNNVDCQAFWFAQQATPAAARAAAIKASLSQAAGKAAVGAETTLTAGTATINYVECNTDWSATQIDLDGDLDNGREPLIYDANGNWRYDAGDSYEDWDNDGHWDYAYYPGTSYDVTEQYSNLVAREFRAKGSQAGSIYGGGGGSSTPPPAASAMIGTWISPATASSTLKVLTILDEATYTLLEDGGVVVPGFSDFEYGNYTYDSITNTFTPYVRVDSNLTSGPGTFGGSIPVVISGNTMTMDSALTFTKLAADPTKPIVGSWAVKEPNPTILTFLDNGTYYISQNEELSGGISAGIERGTYTYSGTTLTATPIVQTHGGGAGFGTIGTPTAITLTITGDNATFTDVGFSLPLSRVGAPAVPASIFGSWFWGSTLTGEFGVVTMLGNNNVVYGDSDPGQPGIEYGSFTYASGQFSATTSIDTTGPFGFTGLSTMFPYTYSMLVDDNGTPFFIHRIVTSVDYPLIGTWGGIDPVTKDGVVFTFLDDGDFMFIQTSPADTVGQPGNEWGTYTWDQTTGALSANILGDLNGEWGMSHVSQINVTVGFNTITGKDELTWQDSDGIRLVPRIY